MRISFDTDGTKYMFHKFVLSYEKYFIRKYDMYAINPKGLEVEEVYDIRSTLVKRGFTPESAIFEEKKILNKFWISHRFIIFSLFCRFEKNFAKLFNALKKQGHELYIDSSRAKTTDTSFIGRIARRFTLWQYKLNGIFLKRESIHFHRDDELKIMSIKERKIDLIFDDKPYVIEKASQFTKVVCINRPYNTDFEFGKNVVRIDNYTKEEVNSALEELFGKKNYAYLLREASSRKVFTNLKRFATSPILNKFKPIILHPENIIETNEAVIFAPNHRSTLDPLVINAILSETIHWAALKRFFTGEDSIFSNSKNFILCKITVALFRRLEFFPIERLRDTPKPNNLKAMRDLNGFIKIGAKIGIFPEGTTLKRPCTYNFGIFEPTFIKIAKMNDTWIQPITLLWIKELDRPEKVIINFSPAFKVQGMTTEKALEFFIELQQANMEEMKRFKNDMHEKKKKQCCEIRNLSI